MQNLLTIIYMLEQERKSEKKAEKERLFRIALKERKKEKQGEDQ